MSYRAAVFSRVGGFDRRTELLEDTDFSVRVAKAGWRLIFEPNAEVVHLSEATGGVREKNLLRTECRRFRSTTYYVLKHRGVLGLVPFLPTFTLIAILRAIRLRSVDAIPHLGNAILEGITIYRSGPDQTI